MSYTALYRKFRPASFPEVKGQDAVVTTLRNQIKAERVGHAYLFCGTRGTGKTSVAKLFAKAVNCEHPVDGSPCGECRTCKNIAAGVSMNVIEIDAASNNSVDNIRDIVEEVTYSPTEGRYKVYIIDEVHMLSISAFNALLKTLEEPPSYVIFILATTESHKIPITILSRCQRYDFKRIGIDTIADRLTELKEIEQISIEDKAVRYIARMADGSMRDALSLLDQCIAFHYGETLTYEKALDVLGAVDAKVFTELLDHVLDEDVIGAIHTIEDVVMQGRELTQFVTEFTWYLRNLMLVATSENAEEALEISADTYRSLQEEAKRMELNTILRYIRIFAELSEQMRYSAQKRILLEVAVIKLCRPQMEKDKNTVIERVRVLEKKVENGVVAVVKEGQTSGMMTGSESTPIVRPKLPSAIPEEITRIVSNWAALTDAMGQPTKSYLAKVRVSLGEDNRLLLVTQDFLGEEYLKRPENLAIIERELQDYINKEVKIEVRKVTDGRDFEDEYVDILAEFGMPVQVEESEEP